MCRVVAAADDLVRGRVDDECANERVRLDDAPGLAGEAQRRLEESPIDCG